MQRPGTRASLAVVAGNLPLVAACATSATTPVGPEVSVTASAPHGVAVAEAGLEARRRGRRAEAQRLFERGLRELERATGRATSLDVPNGFGIDGDGEDALQA